MKNLGRHQFVLHSPFKNTPNAVDALVDMAPTQAVFNHLLPNGFEGQGPKVAPEFERGTWTNSKHVGRDRLRELKVVGVALTVPFAVPIYSKNYSDFLQ